MLTCMKSRVIAMATSNCPALYINNQEIKLTDKQLNNKHGGMATILLTPLIHSHNVKTNTTNNAATIESYNTCSGVL